MINEYIPDDNFDVEIPDGNIKQVSPKVELVAYTPDALKIVNFAARRCYSAMDNDELMEFVDGLDENEQGSFIRSVMKTGHTSTVEHATFTFAVEGVSLVLLKQITRSRIASFSVQSERYVDMDAGFNYIMPPKIMELGDEAMAEYAAQMITIHSWYKGWRDMGIEPEDARYVMPQATETKYLLTMNIRELLHFMSLRCCNRAQWEIKHVTDDMLWLCQEVCNEIFDKAGPSCVQHGKCPEGKRTCGECEEVKKQYAALAEMNRILNKKSAA